MENEEIGPESKSLESQTHVLVAASRAGTQLGAARCFVEIVTTDTMKGPAAALALKVPMIPSVIVEPKAEKDQGHDDAINDNGGREIGHERIMKEKRAEGSFDAFV